MRTDLQAKQNKLQVADRRGEVAVQHALAEPAGGPGRPVPVAAVLLPGRRRGPDVVAAAPDALARPRTSPRRRRPYRRSAAAPAKRDRRAGGADPGRLPYSWGAAGPGAFDCSGLVMWAFQQAGISLPHPVMRWPRAAPGVARPAAAR